MPPYALNGHTLLWAFTLTYLDGSTVKNLYLFKVPDTLVSNLPAGVDLRTAVVDAIKRSRNEWLPFVRWGLELPTSEEEYSKEFQLPREPFDEFKTKAGVLVYRVTNHKL